MGSLKAEEVQAIQKLVWDKCLLLVTSAVKIVTALGNVPLDDSEKEEAHSVITQSQLGHETMTLRSDVLELVVTFILVRMGRCSFRSVHVGSTTDDGPPEFEQLFFCSD